MCHAGFFSDLTLGGYVGIKLRGLAARVPISCLSGKVQVGKKACVLQRRDGCREGLQNSCARVGSPGTVSTWPQFALQLTYLYVY
jgi:hypothetical protein